MRTVSIFVMRFFSLLIIPTKRKRIWPDEFLNSIETTRLVMYRGWPKNDIFLECTCRDLLKYDIKF